MKAKLNLIFLESILDRVQDWIKSIDQKISIFLAFQGVIISLLIPNYIKWIIDNFKTINQYTIFLIVSGLFLIAYSTLKIIYSLSPRLDRKSKNKSIFYFGDISKNSFEEFKSFISSKNSVLIREDLLEQIYINSKISKLKHSHFKDALYIFITGITLLVIAYLIQLIPIIWSIKMN